MVASAGKVALIAGVTGQDGSYLAEFLLAKGWWGRTWLRSWKSTNRATATPEAASSGA